MREKTFRLGESAAAERVMGNIDRWRGGVKREAGEGREIGAGILLYLQGLGRWQR
jgi:hypothetical protein